MRAPDPAPDAVMAGDAGHLPPRPERVPSAAGHGRPVRLWAAYLGICVFGAGLLTIGVSQRIHRWAPPPQPPVSASHATQATGVLSRTAADGGTGRRAPSAAAPGLASSVPVTVRIPAIGVTAHVISVGLDADGAVAAPPLSAPMLAGWYDRGAAPGQTGAAVIVGHVDSAASGPAVFYRLGELLPGDLVYVTRKDNRTVVFEVTSVAMYAETDFPAVQVFGRTPNPTLRLITCGGEFDAQTHHYLDRTIAFASYVGQSR